VQGQRPPGSRRRLAASLVRPVRTGQFRPGAIPPQPGRRSRRVRERVCRAQPRRPRDPAQPLPMGKPVIVEASAGERLRPTQSWWRLNHLRRVLRALVTVMNSPEPRAKTPRAAAMAASAAAPPHEIAIHRRDRAVMPAPLMAAPAPCARAPPRVHGPRPRTVQT
jgi:hypothetical protein